MQMSWSKYKFVLHCAVRGKMFKFHHTWLHVSIKILYKWQVYKVESWCCFGGSSTIINIIVIISWVFIIMSVWCGVRMRHVAHVHDRGNCFETCLYTSVHMNLQGTCMYTSAMAPSENFCSRCGLIGWMQRSSQPDCSGNRSCRP